MSRRTGCGVWRGGLVGLLFVAAMGAAVDAKAFLDWDASMSFALPGVTFDGASSGSTLLGSYFAGDIATLPNRFLSAVFFTDGTLTKKGLGLQAIYRLSSLDAQLASLEMSGYVKEDLVIDWPVGTWSAIVNAAFSPAMLALTRLWGVLNISAYGTSFTTTFAMMPTTAGYATGLTLDLSGTTPSGLTLEAALSFGLPTDFDDLGDLNDVLSGAVPDGFSNAEVVISGLSLGCLQLVSTTTFSIRVGFESTVLEFDFEFGEFPLSFDGAVECSVQTRTVTLTPVLDLDDGGCFWANLGFDLDGLLVGGMTAFDAVFLRGIGASEWWIGDVAVSFILSFVGGVYREVDGIDLELRAEDYYVALNPDVETSSYAWVPYDLIVSMEGGSANADVAVSIYFDGSNDELFGLALITAELVDQVTTSLAIRLGIQIDPSGMRQLLMLGLDASIYLP